MRFGSFFVSSCIYRRVLATHLIREYFLLSSVFLMCFCPSVQSMSRSHDKEISFQTGVYLPHGGDNERYNTLSAEYRYDQAWIPDHGAYPIGGCLLTSAGDVFLFAGLMKHYYITENFVSSISFSPSFYHYGGRSRDLNFPLEFRSKVEFSYELPNRARMGVGVSHFSNAMLSRVFRGLSNPGVEVVSFSYTIPLRDLLF
jgi:hypothetical protein